MYSWLKLTSNIAFRALMILSNIIYRTFFIKAEQYGTAFTLHVDGVEYVITARHLLDQTKQTFDLRLFFLRYWGQIKVLANINQICDLTPIILHAGRRDDEASP
jgi:hypothetical protein